MKAIAERGDQVLLVDEDADLDDNPDAVIRDGDEETTLPVHSALARGYWEPIEDEPEEKLLSETTMDEADMEFLVLETKEWEPYEGPQGGEGWQNTETGEVVYQDEKPGSGDSDDIDTVQDVVNNLSEGDSLTVELHDGTQKTGTISTIGSFGSQTAVEVTFDDGDTGWFMEDEKIIGTDEDIGESEDADEPDEDEESDESDDDIGSRIVENGMDLDSVVDTMREEFNEETASTFEDQVFKWQDLGMEESGVYKDMDAALEDPQTDMQKAWAAYSDASKEWVREEFGDEVTLHRGVHGEHAANIKESDEIDIEGPPSSSWTLDEGVAESYADEAGTTDGVVMTKTVSADDIAYAPMEFGGIFDRMEELMVDQQDGIHITSDDVEVIV